MLRYCKYIFFLSVFLQTSAAFGQVELIIRLSDGASDALVKRLEIGEAGKHSERDALFAYVLDSEPVLPIALMQKAGRLPFRAYTLSMDAAFVDEVEAVWKAHPGVAYVQRNHTYKIDAGAHRDYDDPHLDSLAHLSVIRAYDAWEATTGDADVRIGFVDTGLYFEHPDLSGQVWVNPGEDLNGNGEVDVMDFNGVDDDGNGYVDDLRGYDFVDRIASVEPGDYLERDADPSEDDQQGGGRGHGTSVAGVMAARLNNAEGIAGVAPGTRLVPLRAFGADGIGEDDDVAAAIVYGAELGLDVINLSFGDVYVSPLMHEAIQYAVSRGTIVVASAGNLGGDAPHYPSDYPEVIGVAWLTDDGSSIAGRGTYGPGIDLGAPGSFVFTTLMPRFDEADEPDAFYGRRSGSSLAAPMVSAAAALLRSIKPDLSPASVRSILAASAGDISAPGWDHRTGGGLLNIADAVQRALPARVALTHPEQDGGWSGGSLPIVGTVIDPSLDMYQLFYTQGTGNLDAAAWIPLTQPQRLQIRDDTLAIWPAEGLDEGLYTLRLSATLRTGKQLEDRRRVYLDRTPPVLDLHVFNTGLVRDSYGILLDLATDDLTDVVMEVVRNGQTEIVQSDRRARRHGLVWKDEAGRGGEVQVRIRAVNQAGDSSEHKASFTVPARSYHTAWMTAVPLAVPHGYLLPSATDFDGDGLKEIVFNQYQDGWVGDTLATYEWDGQAFRHVRDLVANVIPRDTGDSDKDGLQELLTQVGGATLLLEQSESGAYPSRTAFVDTTGLANPFDPNAAFGALLADLDGDGRGEILVHNTRQWRVLEWDGNEYMETARLDNPTSTRHSEITENEFQQPLALADDFDGDGRTDLLVGDGDGDWIMYEAAGDDQFRVSWTYETRRYNAGSRFARGDFDGDGVTEFVTFTHNWTQPTSLDVREPDLGLYYVWDSPGDDQYVLVDSIPAQGNLSRHSSLAAADFDGDGEDELVLIHSPDLYVLDFDPALRAALRFHHRPGGDASGIRSIAMVAEDLDGDGLPELMAAHADEQFHLYRVNQPGFDRPPPLWEESVAVSDRSIRLAWHAVGADSVTVLHASENGPFDVFATTASSSLLIPTQRTQRYALQGWFGGERSMLSPVRKVRPHAPAVVASVVTSRPYSIEIVFTEPLDPNLRPGQFFLDNGGTAKGLVVGKNGHSVILRFEALQVSSDTLRWADVRDADGTPVGQTAVDIKFPAEATASLIIQSWEIVGPYDVRLHFSEALDPSTAQQADNYIVSPRGKIRSVGWSTEETSVVHLTLEGRPIGSTGSETSVRVRNIRSSTGNTLAPEGHTVLLTEAAQSLADVYIYPNPFRADEHAPQVTIAGLPVEATVAILTALGEPVRRLHEQDGNGGVTWDLRDAAGALVSSGVYLVRVEAPDQQPVLRKAAVIR